MRVAHVNPKVEAGPCGLLPSRTARHRIRPGESPVWVDVSSADACFDCWRTDSDAVGMPLDGLMAARLELSLAVREAGVSLHVLDRQILRLDPGPAHLPPPPLRTWVSLLTGRTTQPYADELPEVVLPARLAHGLAPDWWRSFDDVDSRTACRWERASAKRGLTISEFVWSAAHRGL